MQSQDDGYIPHGMNASLVQSSFLVDDFDDDSNTETILGIESSPLCPETGDERQITIPFLLRLLEKQSHQCAITGRTLTPDNCVLDHIVPLSDGGRNVRSNVQLVTQEANAAKGQMSMDAFVSLCHDVVSHHNTVCYAWLAIPFKMDFADFDTVQQLNKD